MLRRKKPNQIDFLLSNGKWPKKLSLIYTYLDSQSKQRKVIMYIDWASVGHQTVKMRKENEDKLIIAWQEHVTVWVAQSTHRACCIWGTDEAML